MRMRMRFLVDLQDIRGFKRKGGRRDCKIRVQLFSFFLFFSYSLANSLSLSPTRGYVFGFVGLAVGSPRVKGKKN